MADQKTYSLSEITGNTPKKTFSLAEITGEQPIPEKGYLQRGVEAVESVTGSPWRYGLKAAGEQGLGAGISKYAETFGRPSMVEKAPSGKEAMTSLGVSTKEFDVPIGYGAKMTTSPAGIAGKVAEFVDPTMLAGPVARTGKLAVSGLLRAAPKIEKGVEMLGRGLGAITTKVGGAFTGVPERDIKTYIDSWDKVKGLIKKYGNDVPEASDQIRMGFKNDIIAKKQALNSQIGEALKSTPIEKSIPVDKIIEKLEKSKSSLNPKIPGAQSQINEIDGLINTVRDLTKEKTTLGYGGNIETGLLNQKELFELKNILQEQGKKSYLKDGQWFSRGEAVSRAAKSAATDARLMLNEANPAIREANNNLYTMHLVDERINKGLVTPYKSEAPLLSAGAGTNLRREKELGLVEKMTGSPMIEKAKELSAMRSFSKAPLMTADTTGKGVERSIKAGIAADIGLGEPAGKIAAVAATSPRLLKLAIDTGQVSKRVIEKVLGGPYTGAKAQLETLSNFLGTKEGTALAESLARVGKQGLLEKRGE